MTRPLTIMDFFSGLLSNPFKVDPSFKEGVVTYVDPKRYVCNVETSDKFLFSGIPWLVPSGGSGKGGMTLAPQKGDKVLIYSNAKKAYLYDPVSDKIINIAPLNLEPQEANK